MKSPLRFLPAVIVLLMLGAGGYWAMGALDNAVPKEQLYGCYVHPEHGQFDVTADNVAYNGRPMYEKWSATKATGPLQLVGNPHYSRTISETGELEFQVVKSGMNARDIYGFTDGPAGQRQLSVRIRDADDLVFEEVVCAP